ncbi:type II secretion system protein [Aeromicrobium sp. 179-A 4D2 NHS]|uniref:type II secretion system protein n=1 Tax=Aeromicrobium sp. 179-A 4D2 NHS TaxID=3142375 RepID=UPI0039A37196
MKNTTRESALTRMRNLVAKDGGFTLIEVLAVMVIVGLLAAVAVPQISKWREKAHVTALTTDARSLSQAIEAEYVDSGAYPADEDAALATGGIKNGTTISAYSLTDADGAAAANAATAEGFTFTLTHPKTDVTASYSSVTGKVTKTNS